MKIESTAFTRSDVEQFLDVMLDHDRRILADRLERASARLAELGPRVPAGGGESEWSQHELLAHIAVLSKFYGVLLHKISSGQMTDFNLLENVNLRDVVGEQMAQIEPAELLRLALADQARTLKLLRTVEPSSLRRRARQENGETMSAEEVARLPLINHLEMHIDQLERSQS
jgi:DinB family protein